MVISMALFDVFKRKKEQPSIEKADIDNMPNLEEPIPGAEYPDVNYPGPAEQSYNQVAFTVSEKTRQRMDELGLKRQEPFPQMQTQPTEPSRDAELINSKLDTIKAMLDSLTQRIASIERELHKRW